MKKRWIAVFLLLTWMLAAGCLALAQDGESPDTEATVEYAALLFDDTRIHEIDLIIAEEDWADLVQNATLRTKYRADIIIDGERFQEISCNTKGNSSLYGVIRKYEGSSRFSLRINFGSNIKKQTYHGLRKMELNNLYGDSSCMKNFISYDLFRKAGVPSPLASFVWLKINGRDRGLYLALEDLGKSFLERTAGGEGVLYKPESDKLAHGGELLPEIVKEKRQFIDYGEGAELSYRGEKVTNYHDIFEAEEEPVEEDEEDAQRVIRALYGLSTGKDLDQYLDTSEIIRYFAVHNFLLNYDSYVGPMLHNYYLYERDGRLSMFPWDYNDAFGTFWALYIKGEPNDTTSLANLGMDTPLLGVTAEQRPMWKWIADNEAYLTEYHQAMDAFVSRFFESGYYQEKADALYAMLLPRLTKDPTSFYTPQKFTDAYHAIRRFGMYRAQSIRLQLEGKLSASTADQNPADRIDVSDMVIGDMR